MKTSRANLVATAVTTISLMFATAGLANAQEIDTSSAGIPVASHETAPPSVTPEEFKAGLQQLVNEGKLKLLLSHETPAVFENKYGVVDPNSGTVFLTFVTEIPKYEDRIWGALWGWEPALTFNQTDQTAIITGGAAAVTVMAAAAAAALSETVVGSVISAGVIALVGGAATVYLNTYGKCPASRPTLWVGTLTRSVACR